MTVREQQGTEDLHRKSMTEHHPPSSRSKVQKFISAVFAKFNVSMKKKTKKTTSSCSRRTTTTADDDKTTLVREVHNEEEENYDVIYRPGRNSTADYKKLLMNSSLENGIDFRKEDVSSDKQVLEDLIDWGSTEEANDDVFYRLGRNSTADYKKPLMNSSLENGIDFRKEDVSSDKQVLADLIDCGSTEEANDDVFYALQHHVNPSWLGDPSYSDLVVLTMENCEKCTSLPPLGLLVSLKELTIRGMKGLKSIGSEIYGEGCSKPFLSLEKLSFEDLDECEHWDPTGELEHVEVFSRLCKLSIKRCPKLTANLPDQLPSLQKLVVHECAQLIVSFSSLQLIVPLSSLPLLYRLEIDRCRAIMFRGPVDYEPLYSQGSSLPQQISNWFKQVSQKIECFLFVNCEELMCFWPNEIVLQKQPQGLQHSLITLRELCIENCPNLKAIPEVDFLSVLSILKIGNCNALMSLPEGLQRENARLQHLRIGGCHILTFIFKSQLPSSLKKLEVGNCKKLQYLFDYNTSQSLLEHLLVFDCPSLTRLSSRVEQLAVLKHLDVSECPKLVTLSSSGQLPQTLQHLSVCNCPKLKSIAESFHSNMSLEYIRIRRCEELKLLPRNLNSLSCLRDICIWDCPSLVSFPEGGLPRTNLRFFSLDKCRELKALPEHMHKLNSLEELKLGECASIISMEKEGLPTSLTSLSIADLGFYRPLIEWGLHKLTSLKTLEIEGCVYAESFPQDYTGLVLPTSLTSLTIIGFPRLKYLSSLGLQNLEYLSIIDCPALTSLPELGLPPSLVQLFIYDCPLMKKRCKKNKGEEWFKISSIPCVEINGRFIEDRRCQKQG